jgi:type IV pilus assembly protein PilE
MTRPSRAAAGFTMVELMIVVFIITLLAAIAYPTYMDQVVRVRRDAAKTCLSESAQFMERFYTTNLRFDQTLAGVPVALPPCNSGTDVSNFYTISLTAIGQRNYTVTAVPKPAQASRDTTCGTLGLDNTGTKTESGTGTVDYCW